jgi:N-acetylglutamate synthase-like GNAT family acetyltransferase
MIKFSNDLPQKTDILKIIREINSSENILNYRESEIEHLFRNNNAFGAYLDNKLCGIIAFKEINNNFVEFALILTLEGSRGKGVGLAMYNYMMELLKDRNIYSSSKNQTVQKWLMDSGFKEISFFKLPLRILVFLIGTKLNYNRLKNILRKGRGNWKYYIRFKKDAKTHT